jgi:ABC-type nitrate/sulfonate/bicarbonate transport system substrate-binding protein
METSKRWSFQKKGRLSMAKVMTALLILGALCLAFTSGCSRESDWNASKEVENILIAVTPWPASAALYVAQEKGYFKDEGLDVAFDSYISGHLGLDALFSGKADLATVGDTPIARAVIEGKPVTVIATLCEVNRAVLIVARRDRGILTPGDLKGKTVGVVEGTTAEFFLHIFLTTSYIPRTEVRIVGLETEEVVDALVGGEVDAVSTWFPHTIAARDRLGDNGIVLDDPSIYKMTWNITAAKDFAGSHPERIGKALRAIVRANRFIVERPGEARAVTSGNIGAEGGHFETEWDNYRFTAALDQSLLLNLEDQARWMIGKEAGEDQMAPNFMEFIHIEGLKSVQPAAVGIIGR